MKAACPKCFSVCDIPLGYAGAVSCSCGARFDSYSHTCKKVRNPIAGPSSATPSIAFIGNTINPLNEELKMHESKSRDVISFRMVVLVAVSVVLIAIVVDAYQIQKSKLIELAHFSPLTNKKLATNLPFDYEKISFSNVNFNSVGRGTYFLQVELKNDGKSVINWPVIEVTLLSNGRAVGQKLVSPIEYLANSSDQNVSQLSIAPGQIAIVRMSIDCKEGISAEDYRIRPVYIKK